MLNTCVQVTNDEVLLQVRRRIGQLEEENVSLFAVDLPLVDKMYSRVIVFVPLVRVRVFAAGCIMARNQRPGVICHTVQVVLAGRLAGRVG